MLAGLSCVKSCLIGLLSFFFFKWLFLFVDKWLPLSVCGMVVLCSVALSYKQTVNTVAINMDKLFIIFSQGHIIMCRSVWVGSYGCMYINIHIYIYINIICSIFFPGQYDCVCVCVCARSYPPLLHSVFGAVHHTGPWNGKKKTWNDEMALFLLRKLSEMLL